MKLVPQSVIAAVLAMGVLAPPASAQDYSAAVMTSQPSAYYRFEETSGNALSALPGGVSGTISGSVTQGIASASSALGNCYRFSAGTVVVPHTSATQPTEEWSVELWAKVETLSDPAHLIANGRDVAAGTFSMVVYGGQTGGTKYLGGGNNYSSGAWAGWVTQGARFTEWHHYVYVHSRQAGVSSFFVDGRLVHQRALPVSGFTSNTNPFYIGSHFLSEPWQYPFLGLIDEVAVYRRALPLSEIANHFEAGSGTVYSVPGDYESIQAAAAAASTTRSSIIKVGPGTYPGPISLEGKPIRLVSTSGAEQTTIDGTGLLTSTVNFGAGSTLFTELRGFTVKCGKGTGDGWLAKGGCLFLPHGGGAVESCVLTGSNQGTGYGAGIFAEHPAAIVVRNCSFLDLWSWHGGGAATFSQCSILPNGETIPGELEDTRVLIEGTLVANCYGYNAGGFILSFDDQTSVVDQAIIRNCLFANNTAEYGSNGSFAGDVFVRIPEEPSGQTTHRLSFDHCAFTSNGIAFSVGWNWDSGNGPEVALQDCHFSQGTVRRRFGSLSLQGTSICSGLTVDGGFTDLGGNSGSCSVSTDCNGNDWDDRSEIVAGLMTYSDCNGNAELDACEIAANPELDRDGDGRPDECQTTTVAAGGSIQQAIDASSATEMRIIALGTGTYAGPIHVDGRPVIIRGAGAGVTIIEGSGGAQASVVRLSNAPAISAIENVTIRGGLTGTVFPTFPTAIVGGGLFVYGGNITMRNCIVEDNEAGFGGGAYIWRATGRIENCQFRNNAASADGGGFQLFGGSIDVVDSSATDNFANSRGGGVHVVEGNHEFDGVRIEGNYSNNLVGGLSWVPGNPSQNAFLVVRDSQVVGNTAQVDFGGLDIVDNGAGIRTSLENSQVCGNQPRPNVHGDFDDVGGNTVCECAGDINNDGQVNSIDLTFVLVDFGICGGSCEGDLNDDGQVDGSDLSLVMSGWGVCAAEGLLTGVSPSSGPIAGGTQITITGTYLTGATQVRIGANACTGVQVINSSTIVAVTPAGSAVGAQNVSVVTPLGTITGAGLFSYTRAVPAWATVIEWVPAPAVVYDAAQRAAILATGLPWRVRDTATQMEFVLIPPGSFQMGEEGWATPVHQVTLTEAFYMARYEVTQAQWQATMGNNPSYFTSAADAPSHPVEQVSWNTIQGYLSATGMRLPTEAEWEYACRAGTTAGYHGWPANPAGTNNGGLVGTIAWYIGNSGGQTHAVGQKAANGFGLHDMSGNVWEWVNDWLGSYSGVPQTNPLGPSGGSLRVLRGGSWFRETNYARSSNRLGDSPEISSSGFGFRASRTP